MLFVNNYCFNYLTINLFNFSLLILIMFRLYCKMVLITWTEGEYVQYNFCILIIIIWYLFRTIDPKQCNPRTLQKPKTRGGSFPKVFLGGLPSNVTETDLRMLFGRYGKVMEVVIMYDQEKKKSRGFGFLSVSKTI